MIWWLSGEKSACNAGDPGSISGSGRSLGGGLGNLLHCSCLENPMDRGYWQAVVYRVAKTGTWLKRLSLHHTRFLAALTFSFYEVLVTLMIQGFAVERAGGVQLVVRAAFLDLETLSESCERAKEILVWKFDHELGALYLILVGSQ